MFGFRRAATAANRRFLLRSGALAALAVLAAGALLGSARVRGGVARAAWDANSRVCFPDVINRPNSPGGPPVIDGNIAGDNGWTSSWRYVFMNGTPQNDVTLQALKDASWLYFSFEANRLTQFSASDFLQVVLDNGSGTLHRYMLYPTNGAGAATPTTLQHSTRPTAGGAWSSTPGDVGGATVGIQPVAGNPNTWRVELRIPRGAPANVPASFGLYINVSLTYPGAGSATEYPWPNNVSNWLLGDPDNTPPVAQFGTASLSGAPCNGVYLQWNDIFTSNMNSLQINFTGENRFNAVVHNAMTDGNGSPIAAPNVSATFKIANFGVSGAWANVPWTGSLQNPTPAATIPASGVDTFRTTWTLSPAQVTTYNTDSTRHQCILVDLTASGTPGAVVFSQSSAWTNMNFGTASTFNGVAVFDTRGFGPMLNRRAPVQIFDVVEQDLAGPQLESRFPRVRELLTEPRLNALRIQQRIAEPMPPRGRPIVTRYMHLVHSCLRSGRSIRIKGVTYEICGRSGSYGYLIGHVGVRPAQFSQTLHAITPGVAVQVRPGQPFKQIAVPSNRMVRIGSTIEAREVESPIERRPLRPEELKKQPPIKR